jgi:hypothetical protein
MNNLITPPPDREVPGRVRERQRDELVAIVDHEAGSPRRRIAVPLLAAAAVLAVTAGLAFGVPALQKDTNPEPAGTPPTAGATKVASGNTPKTQQAKTRELSAAETAAFRNQCITFTEEYQDSFASFEVIHAFEYVTTARPSLAKSWLVTRKGMDYWICSRSGYGQVATTFVFGAEIPDRYKDVPYLFAPVDERGSNAGMYIPSVARVTVQHDGEPAVEAALREGFWFAPMEDAQAHKDSNGQPVMPDNHLIGVTAGWTIRGYDGDGKLIYDSAKNGPQVKNCYSNPAATEVVVINSVKHPTPATCQKMFDWK